MAPQPLSTASSEANGNGGRAMQVTRISGSSPPSSCRARRAAVLVAAILCCLAGSAGAAETETGLNPYNDELLRMTPEQRAAKLASFLGFMCIGTKPFLMGVTKEGKGKGYAYWSLECAGGGAFMIQLTPDGAGAAIDCRTLKENGEGRECYKTF
jgi:hypothetical protein